MFMLLKSQTKAIKIIFSVIPNQPKSVTWHVVPILFTSLTCFFTFNYATD